MRQGLSFDDVLIEPKFSDIKSRQDIDISQDFLGYHFAYPIISANMDYVTEFLMAKVMREAGAFYVLHRFMDDYTLYTLGKTLPKPYSISVGIRDPEMEIGKVTYYRSVVDDPDQLVVTVDVAHGHHQGVADMIKRLKDMGVPRVIAGNVATTDGYWFLADAGADAVKVGIGPGAVCTTREVTGVGVPQLSAIMSIEQSRNHRVPTIPPIEEWDGTPRQVWTNVHDGPQIIADGGIKNSGDIVKALAAGADMVMLGSLLASSKDAPGERRTDINGTVWKRYRGQSIFGVNVSHYTPEGIEGWVKENGSADAILRGLGAGIRSGCSYVGARNLAELRAKTEFVQVSQATHLESGTRVRTSLDTV